MALNFVPAKNRLTDQLIARYDSRGPLSAVAVDAVTYLTIESFVRKVIYHVHRTTNNYLRNRVELERILEFAAVFRAIKLCVST